MTFSNRHLAILFWTVVSVLIGAAYAIAKLLRMVCGGNP
jgi:cytochrome c oxidase assembly protein Cox11